MTKQIIDTIGNTDIIELRDARGRTSYEVRNNRTGERAYSSSYHDAAEDANGELDLVDGIDRWTF